MTDAQRARRGDGRSHHLLPTPERILLQGIEAINHGGDLQRELDKVTGEYSTFVNQRETR